MRAVNIHASCVVLAGYAQAFGAPEDAGVLLLGESGAGKSDLALRLIERGAALVADDRVDLAARDGALVASPPKNLAGLLEVRGLGIVERPFRPEARIALAAMLVDREAVARLPEPEFYNPPHPFEGIRVPLVRLPAFAASTPAKIALAAAAFSQNLFRREVKRL